MNPQTEPETEVPYVCLTTDVVGSRSAPNRGELQDRLHGCVRDLNRSFRNGLRVPFSLTMGDELQGLFHDLSTALEAEEHLREGLRPVKLRVGLGVGPVATPLRGRTAEMDGPCFHRAREAVQVSGKRAGATVLRSGRPLWDEPVDAIFVLLSVITEGWSAKQAEAVEAYRRLGTQVAASRELGISQPALQKRLGAAHARPWIEARAMLGSFVGRLWAGGEGGA